MKGSYEVEILPDTTGRKSKKMAQRPRKIFAEIQEVKGMIQGAAEQMIKENEFYRERKWEA